MRTYRKGISKKYSIDNYDIVRVLYDFVNQFNTCHDRKIIILYKITAFRTLKLYSNRPGSLIGPGGININHIKSELKDKGIKDVKVYEIKHVISNCNIYGEL